MLRVSSDLQADSGVELLAQRAAIATQSVARMGVKHAEVITARIVQDECGWLRITHRTLLWRAHRPGINSSAVSCIGVRGEHVAGRGHDLGGDEVVA